MAKTCTPVAKDQMDENQMSELLSEVRLRFYTYVAKNTMSARPGTAGALVAIPVVL